MLYFIVKKSKTFQSIACVVGAACFITIPALVNLNWVTNYIPGIFNLTIVLLSTILFLRWKKTKNYLILIISLLFLFSSLLIYPPTSMFFLLPSIFVFFDALKKTDNLNIFLNNLMVNCKINYLSYLAVVVIYYIFHKYIFLNLYELSFSGGEFYNFSIKANYIKNLLNFYSGPLYNLLSFFGFISPIFFIIFVSLFFITLAKLKYKFKSSIFIFFIFISFITLFSIINLMSPGGPPPFYRSWHALSFVLLLFLVFFLITIFKHKGPIYLLFYTLVLSVFYINDNLVNVLSDSYKFSKSFISYQNKNFFNNFLVLETRPESNVYWAELNFIHIQGKGLAKKIINNHDITQHSHIIYPAKSNIYIPNVFDYQKIDILNNFLHQNSVPLIKGTISASVETDFPVENLSDGIYYTFWEHPISKSSAAIYFNNLQPISLQCITLSSGIDNVPERMPREFSIYGYHGDNKFLISTVIDNFPWKDRDKRSYYVDDNFKYERFSLEFPKSSNSNLILRLYEISLNESC